jgi:hypothetical protein
MAKSHLKLVTPTEVNRTVAPTRRPNAELRTGEHLTPVVAVAGGYTVAAVLMLIAAAAEFKFGIDAEGRALESIAEPLSSA